MPISETQQKNVIQELQTYLRYISFQNKEIPRVEPTGVYNARTRDAVTMFQSLYDLPVTGTVDEETWNAIYSVYKEIEAYLSAVTAISPFPDRDFQICEGDSGATVFILQALINAIAEHYSNIPPVAITGICDAATETAVKALQQTAGLPPSGIIDDRTWDALASLYNVKSYMDWATS
ncbi:MAG: peptidoglycan-binding protein [Ruminococcus sp.]|jgi:peptidoglycan hydrolase-like protein with peptidoglycan-binding domain|nr:peptidoglycan-binding protein [Ruminococcus sp.]